MLRCLEALERVLGPTFGPRGSDVLVVAPGRTALATNSGQEVAEHLSPAHPAGALALEAARAHAAAHGDGSTALLLAVVAGYRQARNVDPATFLVNPLRSAFFVEARVHRRRSASASRRNGPGAICCGDRVTPMVLQALAEASALGGLGGHLSVLRDLERVRSGEFPDALTRALAGASLLVGVGDAPRPIGSGIGADTAGAGAAATAAVPEGRGGAGSERPGGSEASAAAAAASVSASAEDAVWALASSTFCGKLGPAHSELLAHLTTDLAVAALSGGGGGPEAARERLRRLARNPPVVATAGGALGGSCVLDGVLLSEPLRLWDPRALEAAAAGPVGLRQRAGPVRVLLLGVNPESVRLEQTEAARPGGRGGAGASAAVPAALEVRSGAEYEEALQWRQRAAAEAAAALRARGVGLLLCSEHVSELFALAAAHAGAAVVQLLPPDDLRRASATLGAAVCSSSLPSALLAADTGVLDGGFREVSLGNSRGLLLGCSTERTLLLRGPSIAIAQLHRKRVCRALRAVASAAVPPPGAASDGEGGGRGLWLVPGDGAVDLAVAEALGRASGGEGPGTRVLAAAALAAPSWLCRNGPGGSRAHRRLLLLARQAHGGGGGGGSPCCLGIEAVRRQVESDDGREGRAGDVSTATRPLEACAVETPAAVAARMCASADVIVQLMRLGEDGQDDGGGPTTATAGATGLLRAMRQTNVSSS